MKDNVPNYPGYFVSKSGKVFSRFKRGSHELGNKWVEIKPKLRPKYQNVTLYNDVGSKHYYVHRLVAEIYIPNPHHYSVVMHLDNNRLNNHVDNLKWGTQKENIHQCIEEGRSLISIGGDKNIHRKISCSQERDIRRCYRREFKEIANPKKYIKEFIKRMSLKYCIGERTVRKILQYRDNRKIYNILPEVLKDYQGGLSRKELTLKYNISKTTLRKYLKQANN